MAIAFKNKGVAVGTSTTNIYTCPASTEVVIFGFFLSNVDGISNVNVDVFVYDDSEAATKQIGQEVLIPANNTLAWGSKIVLEEGDILQASTANLNDVEAFVSVLEKS